MNVFERLFFRLTARRWNAVIASTICQHYEAGVITSEQMHMLAHEFDPSQQGRVGRMIAGASDSDYSTALMHRGRVA